MSLDCNIVRDLLPLYSEGMVSAETAAQIKEHLSTCPDCLRESERMKDETVHRVNDNGEETLLLKNMKKRMRRHSAAIATISALVAVTAVCVVFALFFLSPGDEMGFSLLAMYLAIPLTANLLMTMHYSSKRKHIERQLTSWRYGYEITFVFPFCRLMHHAIITNQHIHFSIL